MIRSRVALVATICTLILGGCVTTQTVEVTRSALHAEFEDRVIAILVYSESQMALVTPGDITGAGLLDGLTRPDGTKVAFASPSLQIANRLKTTLDSGTDLNFQNVASVSAPPPKRADVRMDARDTLEVFTEVHQLGYRPLNWQTYQYMIRANARLTGADGRIISQGVCKVGGPSDDKSLQIDRTDINKDGGSKLINLIESAAHQCADQIAASLVGH